MRTTIDIPDELLRQAKQRSLDEGRTLGSVLTDGLRVVLMNQASPESRRPVSLVTYGKRGTRPGVDLDSNSALRDLMDAQ